MEKTHFQPNIFVINVFNIRFFQRIYIFTMTHANITQYCYTVLHSIVITQYCYIAPIKRRKIRNKSNPWITEQLLHEKRHKNYLKQKACKTGNLNDWEDYKHTRNNYNKLIKNTIKSHFSNDIQNNKGNLKKTWKSINQCLNRNPKSNKIVLIKDTKEQDIKSEDMANAFNEHFINIGSNLAQLIPQTNYPPEYYINSVDKIFTFREITEEEVKLSAPLISHAMTVIFNKSIVSGTFPCEWKISKVTPVYKTGPREDMNNYRPILSFLLLQKQWKSWSTINSMNIL